VRGVDRVQTEGDRTEEHKPIVIGTWDGSDVSLPCLLLNSHVDVVPAMIEHWTVPPFDGVEINGRVYGRGAQDMKSVCVQYIIALRKLKASSFIPKRTIHLTFVPDEEVGGSGIKTLMESSFFKSLKIGLALDEGLANESESYSLFYGERLPWWVKVVAEGSTGHGSRFIDCTAVEQAVGVMNKALAYRQDQKDALFGKGKHAGCSHAVAKTLGM
jgi:aminoacylase